MRHYLLFYKPYLVLTSFTDPAGRLTLANFIPVPDVYPVGRLDYRSEGLLLLTNDGRLAHRLTDPNFEHPKTYLVQLEGCVTAEAAERLSQGVLIQGRRTRPAEVAIIPPPDLPPRQPPVRPYHPTSWLRIVLREGKKRQIRHMTAAVGFPTLRLVRVAIGPLHLGDLLPGQWRPLTPSEIASLHAG